MSKKIIFGTLVTLILIGTGYFFLNSSYQEEKTHENKSEMKQKTIENTEEKISFAFLVVDLENDGVPIIPLEKSEVTFDYDLDGKKEKTEWITPEDGFLMVMSVHDGNLPREEQLTAFLKGGLEKFFKYDFDKNYKYTPNDTIKWPQAEILPLGMHIWIDENMNGYPEDREIRKDIHNNPDFEIDFAKNLKIYTGSEIYEYRKINFRYK